MRVLFSPKSISDLTSIATYSRHQWGEEQARNYVNALELTCRNLGQNFQLGREVDGFRRWRYERHLIYYVVTGGDVLVVRILHERMLPSRHL